MKKLIANEENITEAARIIKSGGLVAFPTETVYGLGADGFNPFAVSKIFDVKKRPEFNPLILHIAEVKQIDEIARIEHESVKKLMEKFWPGPLTLVLPKKSGVPEIVTAGNPTVAVRMPANDIALKLIRLSGRPIAAPSANLFGRLSPTTAEHVVEQLGDKIDLIIDGGKCEVGVESTIIKVEGEKWSLLRLGGLNAELLIEVLGEPEKGIATAAPVAPGMLPYHYAPKTPIKFLDEITAEEIKGKKSAALLFYDENKNPGADVVKILSPKRDFREAAANLFDYLHDLENENVEIIIAERIPAQGLGAAIMDRLKKAREKFSQ